MGVSQGWGTDPQVLGLGWVADGALWGCRAWAETCREHGRGVGTPSWFMSTAGAGLVPTRPSKGLVASELPGTERSSSSSGAGDPPGNRPRGSGERGQLEGAAELRRRGQGCRKEQELPETQPGSTEPETGPGAVPAAGWGRGLGQGEHLLPIPAPGVGGTGRAGHRAALQGGESQQAQPAPCPGRGLGVLWEGRTALGTTGISALRAPGISPCLDHREELQLDPVLSRDAAAS